jgi:hypothetical protein
LVIDVIDDVSPPTTTTTTVGGTTTTVGPTTTTVAPTTTTVAPTTTTVAPTTTTTTTIPPPPLDHFRLYLALGPDAPLVNLEDQFDELGPRSWWIRAT